MQTLALLRTAAVAALLCASSAFAAEGDYPTTPVKVIVPFAPAGGTPAQFRDTIAREIGVWKKVARDANVKVV